MTRELEKKYEQLYNYCKPIIDREVRFFIKNKQDGEELANNAFLRICKKLHLYQRHTHFIGWVRILTRNICLRALERKRYFDDIDKIHNHPATESVEYDYIRSETLKMIQDTIEYLPKDRIKLMQLKYKNHLPNAAIGRILGIPEGTVKSRINRTFKKIKKLNPNLLCQ